MVLKEIFNAAGLELDVRNLIIDYKLKDGRYAHVTQQVLGNQIVISDDRLIETVRNHLPEGSRICTVFEVQGDYELPELERLCTSIELMRVNKRCVFMDKELAEEYIMDSIR